MRANEHFLDDVLGFVGIVCERERPAEDGRLISRDESGEGGIIAGTSERGKLHIERVRGTFALRDRMR
jgi:hypothetical protein